MLLDHHLKAGRLRFLDKSVATSNDEHDFVTAGVQSHCATQGDSSGSGHKTCHELSDPQTIRHLSTPWSVKVGAKSLSSGGTGRSPRVTARHGRLAVSVRAT